MIITENKNFGKPFGEKNLQFFKNAINNLTRCRKQADSR